MTTFDTLFLHFFKFYKDKKNKKANRIATVYVTFLQATLLLLLGVFFAGFFSQMNVSTMSSTKAWTLFVLVVVFLSFKNWMNYGGKKRNVLNSKMLKKKKLPYNILLLWFLPFVLLALCYVLSMAT